jgi:GntR family transcriptional regulator, transcriptional repressor for pyruvate dehydrogenase complex
MTPPPAAPAGIASDRPMPTFARFPRASLPEEIANRLLVLIQGQELRPGDKLPAERELAQMMGVSRPVLREALRALSIMRVVDIRHGDGTYITALEPQQLIAHLDFVFAKDSVALGTLFEARRVVEVANARFAAGRIRPESIARLEALLVDLGGAIDDPEHFGDLDMEFHNTICDAAGNFLLSQFMRIINTMGKVSRQRTGAVRSVRQAAHRDHRAILDALRQQDMDAAEAAMREHLDHIEAALDRATPSSDGPGNSDPGDSAAPVANGGATG